MTFPFPVPQFATAGTGANDIALVASGYESVGDGFTMPTVIDGDVAVWFAEAGGDPSLGGDPPNTTPSGWTLIDTVVGVSFYLRRSLFGKVCAASDSGVFQNFPSLGDNEGFGPAIYAIFRRGTPVTAITVGDPDLRAASGNPSAQTLLTAGVSPPLIAIGAGASFELADYDETALTFTPEADGFVGYMEFDAEFGSGFWGFLKWKFYKVGTAAPNHTIDMADLGDENALGSAYLRLT